MRGPAFFSLALSGATPTKPSRLVRRINRIFLWVFRWKNRGDSINFVIVMRLEKARLNGGIRAPFEGWLITLTRSLCYYVRWCFISYYMLNGWVSQIFMNFFDRVSFCCCRTNINLYDLLEKCKKRLRTMARWTAEDPAYQRRQIECQELISGHR